MSEEEQARPRELVFDADELASSSDHSEELLSAPAPAIVSPGAHAFRLNRKELRFLAHWAANSDDAADRALWHR